jgi:hypothetical protein
MTTSEMMTIVVSFHMSHDRNFKNCSLIYVTHIYKDDFPNLLSYTLLLEVIPRVIVPTSIKICHNIRTPRHKTFDGIVQRGKGTMGWFYGFKIHLVVNYNGEIVAAKVTIGNVHDTQLVAELAEGLTDKLYGDKGYLSQALAADLFEKGVTLVTTVRENMKAKAISLWDRAMLSRRYII